ncbi:MAG: hypothetical protein NTX53_09905 [candidate division WOR-3 bacterium]|nr:hypothetical protein [candidate division WOR-3 bacterium]
MVRILFACIDNSRRSQMAKVLPRAWLRRGACLGRFQAGGSG